MASVPAPATSVAPTGDQRVFLHGVTWAQFESLLAIRGESGGVRMTYLEGELELMSPSFDHEAIKKCIARLLEAWADEVEIDLFGAGSWTVKQALRERGVEPDECYIVGPVRRDRPDIAIEVVWTHGGIDKLEVYRGLGVPEVWIWIDGRIDVHRLRGQRYVRSTGSRALPALDLAALTRFVDPLNQSAAVRRYRRFLRE